MASDHNEVLANFMAITGVDNEATALSVLEATDWKLDQAVDLHFASGGVHDAGHAPPASGGPSRPAGLDSMPYEEEVRAPLPTKVERLYGDAAPDNMASMHARVRNAMYGQSQYGLQGPQRAAPQIETFRNFKAEAQTAAAAAAVRATGTAAAAAHTAGGAGASSSAASQPGSSQPGSNPLHAMFKPPDAILYKGDLATAGQVAAKEGRWLLINIQSEQEFGSLQLNRDTFSQPMLQDVIKGMFLFIQVMDSSHSGRSIMAQYRLTRLPTLMVLDPITGAKLFERAGFVDAEKLMEDLVPFMDCGPQDPGAAQLAQQMAKRKAGAAMSAAAPGAGAGGGAGSRKPSSTGSGGGGGGGGGAMTEDEQLAMAIAMSMEQGGEGATAGVKSSNGGAGSDEDYGGDDDEDNDDSGMDDGDDGADDGIDEEAIWAEVNRRREEEARKAAQPTPEQAVAAAQQRLPPEPGETSGGACRVAFRLPSGERLQRRFMTTDTLQALHDYVVVNSAEAAAGKQFTLSLAAPGAIPLTDLTQSLQDAHVQNAMLAVKWVT